jgi:tryptophan synthase alpha chain
MNPLTATFQRLRAAGRKAFLPFLTAGDPDLNAARLLLDELVAAGADVIEIGFPYSDPIADGPVIQASYTRALAKGLRVQAIFDAVRAWQSARPVPFPLVAMVSFSLVQRRGLQAFVADAAAAGFAGAIVPDLPIEEAAALAAAAARRDFQLIQLITPTTPRDRAKRIAAACTGFIYYVSVTGITGTRDSLPDTLREELAWLRGQTDLPICVGFGISKPEQVRMLRDHADGVIVGSALVRRLEQVGELGLAAVVQAIGASAGEFASALA